MVLHKILRSRKCNFRVDLSQSCPMERSGEGERERRNPHAWARVKETGFLGTSKALRSSQELSNTLFSSVGFKEKANTQEETL